MNLFEQLNTQLIRDEGMILNAYQDSLGYWTIGIGRLIDKRKNGGITVEEAGYLLSHDIAKAKQFLDRELPWAQNLDEARYGALIAMTFNMGGNLLQFKKGLAAFSAHNFDLAAVEFSDSTWAKQVGKRAERLCEQIRSGVWQ